MLKHLIDRPVAVTMVLLSIVTLGLVSLSRLPVSLIPDVDIPYVTVQITAGDMSARELDEAVVKPLRQSLIQTADLEDIRTESRDGDAVIELEFSHGTDINYAYVEVNEKIDRAMSALPEIERPRVMKASATDIPAFYLNLTLAPDAQDDFAGLSRFAGEVVVKRIEQLPEVAMVDITGGVAPEILVVPDLETLSGLGLDADTFRSLVEAANVSLGNLTIRDGEYRYNVRFRSFASSAEDVADVRFKVGDRILQIRDVAEVTERPAPVTGGALSNGSRAIVMAVIKQGGARMSDLRSAIEEQMSYFEWDYPQVDFTLTRDQTELLEYSINNLFQNIVVAVLLTCLIIFLFMKDFRSPALVALTIPAALVFSMLVFGLVGLTINIISLSGLILGVGMMVDNSIVLIDNITARWNRGDNLRTAVLSGTKEVIAPMLSSVLTTCAVFIPLIFMSGIAGALFYDQAMAVTIVLLTAYVVTITVIPVYYYLWYKGFTTFRPSRLLGRIAFPGAMRAYGGAVLWGLRNRWTAWVILVSSVAVAVLCMIWIPKEKLPPMTYTDAIAVIDWNENITYDENLSRMKALYAAVEPGTEQITSLVGTQRFILTHTDDQSVSEASMYFKCRDDKALSDTKHIIGDWIASRYPDALLSFEVSGNIFDAVFAEREAGLVARLRPVSSPELGLEDLRKVLSEIRMSVPGVRIDDVPVKEDVVYVADPEKMALYGVSYPSLLDAFAVALDGDKVFSILRGNVSVPVVVGSGGPDMSEMTELTVRSGNGTEVRVSDLMRQTYGQDLKTLVSGAEGDYYPVELDVPSRDAGKVMSAVSRAVAGNGDFEVSYDGSYFSDIRMTEEMLLILAVAILLLFLILASQFESLVQPLIILSEILVDIAASLAVMWIAGVSVNLMSLIGLVVICGIVINDSILKIDTINRLRRDGMGIDEAIIEAGHRRVKAILMTSLTTILSVVPFLSRGNMGDDLQYPMSVVIIVGMTVGTLISLYLIPVLYSSIYNRKSR